MEPKGSLDLGETNRNDEAELEWIFVRSQLENRQQEGLREKMVRKTKDNPFVPIGALLTTVALSYGLWCMRSGDSRRSQLMMRARVLAQGFTVVALVGGIGIGIVKKYSEENKKS